MTFRHPGRGVTWDVEDMNLKFSEKFSVEGIVGG